MKKNYIVFVFSIVILSAFFSFKKSAEPKDYLAYYHEKISEFKGSQLLLVKSIQENNLESEKDIATIKEHINTTRLALKKVDFWLRYLEPVSYKKINGPLPVEWEKEVFEKFEAPYKRKGAGLTLSALYLEEEQVKKDSLISLLQVSLISTNVYLADSIVNNLVTPDHFFLCNRLFLLNLAAIYTTGFECPDTSRIIPELCSMLKDTYTHYLVFNASFPEKELPSGYLDLYRKTISFVNKQTLNFLAFNHYTFIKDYVNPLFSMNQKLIRDYNIISRSNVDYALNKNTVSIFSKDLYRSQNAKGIFIRVYDKAVLEEIEKIGKLLFYDPVLSGNNLRSCSSCHDPSQYFTDTLVQTSMQFDRKNRLPRNSPSLINAEYNHLLMLDGKHISLQDQTKDVITNSLEMACAEKDVLKKILSCSDYKKAFKKFLKYTPQEKEITLEHVSSAITLYYSRFSRYYSPFDKAMNYAEPLNAQAKEGFNVFMGKAQCATCHFVPQFNGVKPPYVSSEFEVLGVPKDSSFAVLSTDKGRYLVNPAIETVSAFRTGSLRNVEKTKPYMHNGSFTELSQVIDFYDAGGGVGKGLKLPNQTLSSDSLHLTKTDKKNLLAFIKSLNEAIEFEKAPEKLPVSKIKRLNARKNGGEY